MEKLPLLSAVAVPKTLPSSLKRVTVEPASAVPVIVGFELLVIGEAVAKEEGASGAVVSIVKDIAADFEEILPAESVAVALIEY